MTTTRPSAGRAAALIVAGVASAQAPAAQAAGMTALDLCDMKPAFSDDFDALSVAPHRIGPARWTAHTPWNGDFGDAAFTDPGPNGPFSVSDGQLSITARKDASGRWRSGLLAAADPAGQGSGTQYGYFEARMRLPPGPGTWPAFWLASLKPGDDSSPGVEIDVIEYYGHSTAAYSSALHVWYKGDASARSRHTVHHTPVPDRALVEGFHTYGVRVDPNTITYYFDRMPVWERPTPVELDRPLFPLVNLALGSGFPIDRTPDPSVLLVDYVHVFALDPAGRDARCPPAAGAAQPNP